MESRRRRAGYFPFVALSEQPRSVVATPSTRPTFRSRVAVRITTHHIRLGRGWKMSRGSPIVFSHLDVALKWPSNEHTSFDRRGETRRSASVVAEVELDGGIVTCAVSRDAKAPPVCRS